MNLCVFIGELSSDVCCVHGRKKLSELLIMIAAKNVFFSILLHFITFSRNNSIVSLFVSPDGTGVYSAKRRECLWRLQSTDWFQIALDFCNSRIADVDAMHCNLRRTMRMYVTRIDYRNVCSCILSTSFAVEELWISLSQCWRSNKKRDERKRIVDTYTRTRTHTHTHTQANTHPDERELWRTKKAGRKQI